MMLMLAIFSLESERTAIATTTTACMGQNPDVEMFCLGVDGDVVPVIIELKSDPAAVQVAQARVAGNELTLDQIKNRILDTYAA